MQIAETLQHDDGARNIVVDDLRFPSDWRALQSIGGKIFRVRRASKEVGRTGADMLYHKLGLARAQPFWSALGWVPIHETEFHWPDAPVEAEIYNNSDKGELLLDAQAKIEAAWGKSAK